MRGAKRHADRRRIISIVFLGALAALVLGVAGCDKRLARMEENQIRLQAMVAANARQLATISSQVHVNDSEIQDGIQKLQLNDQDLATGISTVQNHQDALHQTVTSASDAIDRRMATLDANQKLLQDGVSQVAGVAQRTASDVTAVAREQVTLHQMVASGRRELADGIAAVAANGDRIRTDIGQLQQTDQRMTEQIGTLAAGQENIRSGVEGTDKLMHTVAGDVTSIAQGQADLHRTVNEHDSLLADKAAILEQNQQGLQAGVNGLSEKIGQTHAQLAALAAGQDAVRETIRSDNGTVTARLAGLSESQTGLQSGLTGLHRKADILVSDVGTVQTGQAGLRDTLMGNHEAVTNQVAQLAGEQQQLQGQVDALLATAGQTELDIVALGDSNAALQRAIQTGTTRLTERTDRIDAGLAALATEQSATRKATTDQSQTTLNAIREAVQQTLQNHNEAVHHQIAGLAVSQQRIQNDLDVITATAGQTALDVLAVASRQDALRDDLQDHNQTVESRMTRLAGSQEQIQSGLDVVTATSGQTALDTIALNEGQARLAQAVQADRKALADSLAQIVHNQQQWTERFDVAQANVQTIATNLTALEQHLTKLQGSLQPSLDGLTSQLGASGQNRMQFETKVNQDIQAIVEAIVQFRQDQAALTDQMQQIQTRAQTQTKDILTAIQQLRLPPAEVKVSDSGTTLESSVAEAAAK